MKPSREPELHSADPIEPYSAYEDSGNEWLGLVPSHWDVRRLRNVCELRVSNVDKHTKDGEVPVRLCNYVDVYKNDRIRGGMTLMAATATADEVARLRLRLEDVLITKDSETWNDIGVPALVGEMDDAVVSGYHLALLRPDTGCLYGGFLFRAFESRRIGHQLHVRANGVTRYGLSHDAIKSVWLPVPPRPEQAAIVRFLDHVDRRIQRYIRAKEKLIALLEEQKQAIIYEAVTGRIDVRTGRPYSAYRDSGVEWLGEVPAHWAVERAKWLFSKMARPVRETDEVVTCFRDGVVTLRKNRRVRGFTESLQEIGYQGIRRGDLVIHGMDAFAGAIGVADADGKGSPVYSVCEPGLTVSAEYFAHVLREMARGRWIQALTKGIRERSTDFRFENFGSQYVQHPRLSEQTAIVRFLDRTTSNMATASAGTRRLIERVREYRTRLIADVVIGKLDVREAAAKLPEVDPLAAADDLDDSCGTGAESEEHEAQA